MLNYQTHIDKGSMFNTPPVFPIYVSMLNLRWLKGQGGITSIAARNEAKATLIYKAIDENPMFKGVTAIEDRSTMNATFTLADKAGEEAFLKMCAESNISGIKGHRSVGGFRASMYNAMPLASVETLTKVMHEFATANV
jgi:phosphoserine aminotransferase